MNRKERLRAYWEERLPHTASFYLVDAARYINRDRERPIVSLRTLQRRALEGALAAQGGTERAIREYKVLREDLIEFLVSLDVITGSEPREPRPRTERPKRKQRRGKRQQKEERATAAPPRAQQRTLFD